VVPTTTALEMFIIECSTASGRIVITGSDLDECDLATVRAHSEMHSGFGQLRTLIFVYTDVGSRHGDECHVRHTRTIA
jgi:hypothetical protein